MQNNFDPQPGIGQVSSGWFPNFMAGRGFHPFARNGYDIYGRWSRVGAGQDPRQQAAPMQAQLGNVGPQQGTMQLGGPMAFSNLPQPDPRMAVRGDTLTTDKIGRPTSGAVGPPPGYTYGSQPASGWGQGPKTAGYAPGYIDFVKGLDLTDPAVRDMVRAKFYGLPPLQPALEPALGRLTRGRGK